MHQVFTSIRSRDDQHECDCCGKSDIKVCIEVQHIATGERFIFGPQCARSATHPWGSLSPKYSAFIPHSAADEGDEDHE